MSRAKTFDIDGDKLRNLILATGRTLREASVELGGSEKYLAGICREGKATAQCMSLIGLALAIPKDLYMIKPEVPDPEEDDPKFTVEELLAKIAKDLEQIIRLMEGRDYEQKTFSLPFGDADHSGGADDLPF